MEAIDVDQISHVNLAQTNSEISRLMDGDVVFINSGIVPPLDAEFRVAIEDLKEQGQQDEDHLIVVLETNGGLMETVERLVAVMRTHYERVSFVVPNFAYSAGTVLALSGDKIFMDYYSVLGPIDPQYRGTDGTFLPGQGMLTQYKELVKTINAAANRDDVRAELSLLIRNFHPAQLFQLEQAVQHGVTLITEWLPQYKFKDWTRTEGKGTKVTSRMKKYRARKIATTLGQASRWHSHGRGIPMKRLQSDEVRLVIDDFGADSKLSSAVRNYHGLAVDYFAKMGMHGYVYTKHGVRRIA